MSQKELIEAIKRMIPEFKVLEIDQLKSLIGIINNIIEAKSTSILNKRKYLFHFQELNSPRNKVPYVARLFWNQKKNKLDRRFFTFVKTYGKNQVSVRGTYEVYEGDVIEVRTSKDMFKDTKKWYIVLEGQLILLADNNDSSARMEAVKYLQGVTSVSSLVKYSDSKRANVSI